MQKLFISQKIYTERGCVDGAILIEGVKIKQIFRRENIPSSFIGEIVDCGNQRIIPGIIEMHIHGFKGWSAFSSKKEELRNLARAVTAQGVTAFTPTNHYKPNVFENTKALGELYEEPRIGARHLGIHFEGPFISPKTLGSVEKEELHEPDLNLMKKFYELSKGHINTVTMAPEIEGNLEILDWLVVHGINPCIGHSYATYQECEEAIDRGAIITQKTGNCMRGIHQREVGVVGAAMLDYRIYNEINSDLAHCSQQFLEILYRMKGYQKLCLIADNGRMSGLPFGCYDLKERGGKYEVCPDGLLHIADGTIDGSSFTILDGIKHWVEIIGIPLEEAIVMASLNPAKVCHVDHHKGSIKEGKDADLVVIDDDYKVLTTIVEGDIEYDKKRGDNYDNPEYLSCLVELYE